MPQIDCRLDMESEKITKLHKKRDSGRISGFAAHKCMQPKPLSYNVLLCTQFNSLGLWCNTKSLHVRKCSQKRKSVSFSVIYCDASLSRAKHTLLFAHANVGEAWDISSADSRLHHRQEVWNTKGFPRMQSSQDATRRQTKLNVRVAKCEK